MKSIVFVNGEPFTPEEAKVSVFDRGFLYGDAVYEVTRSYGQIFFQMEPHLERLQRSANSIGISLNGNMEQIRDRIYSCYHQVGSPDYYMRIQVTRGEGAIGLNPNLAERCNEVIYFQPFHPVENNLYENGISIAVVDRLRNSKQALDPNIKSGNYLNNVLAYRDGMAHNAFETIMVNAKGDLAEGTTSNLFILSQGTLKTPPKEADILYGITRGLVIKVAQKLGIPVEETFFDLKELQAAEGAFITSSTREILPISTVNSQKTFSSIDETIRALAKGYKDMISEYIEWAKPIHPWEG